MCSWQAVSYTHLDVYKRQHKLTPPLAVLQNKGFRVAIVTDGRMSGASGKIPAAIHLTPEASAGGPLAKVRDGDIIRLNATVGMVNVCLLYTSRCV